VSVKTQFPQARCPRFCKKPVVRNCFIFVSLRREWATFWKSTTQLTQMAFHQCFATFMPQTLTS